MIYLNPNSLKFKNARNNHKVKLIELLYGRIEKLKNIYSIKLFNNIIINDLELILSGGPATLFFLSKSLMSLISTNESLIKDVKYVFNYKWFINKVEKRYCGYELASALGVSTCVYCNRNYTNTVITKDGKKLIRPQFDHYFDKDSHPLLALSFFNLIPSCSICNTSIKHKKEFTLNTHVHPYLDNISEGFKFSYSYKDSPYYKNGLKVDIDVFSDLYVKNTLKDLEIEEVYNAHTDVLYDLIKLRQTYSNDYLSILKNSVLDGVKISDNEMYRLAFGTEYDDEKFKERPFSKFKKDILKELGII